jgi:hypothetical protein
LALRILEQHAQRGLVGMSQPEIARRLHRHKTWVWLRLMLVEALEPRGRDRRSRRL